MTNLARDKHSSLFCLFISDEESKVFLTLTQDLRDTTYRPQGDPFQGFPAVTGGVYVPRDGDKLTWLVRKKRNYLQKSYDRNFGKKG